MTTEIFYNPDIANFLGSSRGFQFIELLDFKRKDTIQMSKSMSSDQTCRLATSLAAQAADAAVTTVVTAAVNMTVTAPTPAAIPQSALTPVRSVECGLFA